MEAKAKDVAQLLKNLANDNRLLILCALMENPMTVGELGTQVPNISQPALSQHLSLLKAHGILACTKAGQHITYFISDKRVEALIDTIKEYYC